MAAFPGSQRGKGQAEMPERHNQPANHHPTFASTHGPSSTDSKEQGCTNRTQTAHPRSNVAEPWWLSAVPCDRGWMLQYCRIRQCFYATCQDGSSRVQLCLQQKYDCSVRMYKHWKHSGLCQSVFTSSLELRLFYFAACILNTRLVGKHQMPSS